MVYLRGIWYSLPVQLVFLHFRKYQVLMVFWLILFTAVNGTFLKSFGADALFLAPEYMGNVNAMSAAFIGIAVGAFIMCWNITTFILFSQHFSFLAATQFPFFKYCINNSAIPFSFLIFYFIKAYQYAHYKELIPNLQIVFISLGFLGGLVIILAVSLLYFYRADKTIFRRLQPLFEEAKNYISQLQPDVPNSRSLIRSEWFLTSFASFRRCRDVSHYSPALMEKIFKQHHFAAVVSILFATAFLIFIGFFMEYSFFQIPAGASAIILFAILIGISGAITYFFQSWSLPFLLLFLLTLNFFYNIDVIDPRNRAYGLSYKNEKKWPQYTGEVVDSLAAPHLIQQDKANMISILEKWKAKQDEEKPLLVLMTTSGGGNRSATFTMNILQRLDSISNGKLFKKTFLITGASGGMIGATYFRELYRQKAKGENINLQDAQYVDNIANDLLNATFSSFITRDVLAPAQYFNEGPYRYIKDRGYSFESRLNRNTGGILNNRLKDYVEDEKNAVIPLMLYHSLISRDAKKLLISSQHMRFMMQPLFDSTIAAVNNPDAVDFTSFFAHQDPYNLRLLTILRMNATFPIVLPAVWLPTQPVIDVMDGGLRDNYGIENCLRFLSTMNDWIKENTKGVLIVQIRDRKAGGWDRPYELAGFSEHTIKPIMLLQNNWSKMMEYFQNDMYTYFAAGNEFPIYKVVFQYASNNVESKAALSFHLANHEKLDIAASLSSDINTKGFEKVLSFMKPAADTAITEK